MHLMLVNAYLPPPMLLVLVGCHHFAIYITREILSHLHIVPTTVFNGKPPHSTESQVSSFSFITLYYVVNLNNYGTIVTMVGILHTLNLNESIFITL